MIGMVENKLFAKIKDKTKTNTTVSTTETAGHFKRGTRVTGITYRGYTTGFRATFDSALVSL